MVDEEVANILREIRERVRAQELPTPDIANSARGDGAGESSITSREAAETSATEALARIDSYLAITARTWDRLPPLLSNRSGVSARLELWVKRQIKRAAHWFTWEQINFNAAVHHALRDALQALSNYEQALETLRAGLLMQIEGQREMQLEAQREMQIRIEAQREMQIRFEAQRELQIQIEAQHAAQSQEIDARLSALTGELNGRVERMQEEQRVCFKQLSLEATEAAVLEDRGRRKTETLVEELKRRVEQLENSDK